MIVATVTDIPSILILEASDANGALFPSAESDALTSLGQLLTVQFDVCPFESLDDANEAATRFNAYGYSALYIVSHGSEAGLHCPNGDCLDWDLLASLFDFKNPDLSSLILSSCDSLASESLFDALKNSQSVPPRNVFGFKEDLDARDAIPAGCLLIRAMAANDSSEIAAALAAIYLSLKLDMWYYVRNRDTDEYDYVSGAQVLNFLVDPSQRHRGWYQGILVDRGLNALLKKGNGKFRQAS